MGLDDDLDGLLAITKPHPRMCAVRWVLERLEPEQAEKVNALIEANVVAAPKIATVLNKHGFDLNDKAIARHRRRKTGGGCSCP